MKNKIHIYYWSPFISKVATVNAVLGSIKTLKAYSNQKYEPHIINAAGEWNKYKKELNENNINIIKLTDSKIIDNSNYTGFFKSRLVYLYLFFILLIPLLKLLKKFSNTGLYELFCSHFYDEQEHKQLEEDIEDLLKDLL